MFVYYLVVWGLTLTLGILHRNFPDFFHRGMYTNQEKETKLAMKWFKQYPFVLSANFHGGAKVVNYPYDASPNIKKYSPGYSASPDDDIFRKISKVYSYAHTDMYKGYRQCGDQFTDGKNYFLNLKWYSLFLTCLTTCEIVTDWVLLCFQHFLSFLVIFINLSI